MPTKVLMPQLGESVDECTITKWLVAQGERVEEYDPLVEVNTDKVDTEIPSPATGVLLEILVDEGITVKAGQLLAWIGEEGEAFSKEDTAPGITTPKETEKSETQTRTEEEEVKSTSPTDLPTPGRDRDLGFISPVVAKIAAEYHIDLYQVQGTGREGRITKRDILAYLDKRESQPETQKPTPSPTAPEPAQPLPPTPTPKKPSAVPGDVIPMTAVRRAIAEHMVMSKRTSPHVTTVMDVDLSRVVSHREANKAAFGRDGVNLTFTAYFVSATVKALKAYPVVNSSWSDEGVILKRDINIGMATSLGEEGLIVPVIKQADTLSLFGLARTINDLASRARAHKLQPDEVQNGTFTITNHGVSGSLFATPIINQPQCAILGVGAIQKRVIVISDQNQGDSIAIRPMAYLTLTFDHRILDGAIADYFLGKIVDTLQNWS